MGGSVAERGVTSVEYALLVAVIVVLLAGGLVTLFDAVRDRFDRTTGCAATAYRGQGC